MLNQDAGTDARMAADVCPAADYCATANAYAVADYRPVTDPCFPVDPAPVPYPAAGTDVGAMLHIGHRPDAGVLGNHGSRCYESASIGMAHIPGDLAGVVLN